MVKHGRRYNPAMIQFLRDEWPNNNIADLTRLFNKAFGKRKTQSQIKSALSNHSIRSGRTAGDTMRGRLRLLTEEQAEFVRQEYQKGPISHVTKALNERFGLSIKESQIRTFTRNHGIRSGRTGQFEKGLEPWNTGMKGWQAGGRSVETQFKKGYASFNQVEIGTEVVDTYGYRKR